MYSASRELCEELFKLTGWLSDCIWIPDLHNNGWNVVWDSAPLGPNAVPAYSIGWLLRMLPHNLMMGFNDPKVDGHRTLQGNIFVSIKHDSEGIAGYNDRDTQFYCNYGSTPEDALCNLATMLIKKGILEL